MLRKDGVPGPSIFKEAPCAERCEVAADCIHLQLLSDVLLIVCQIAEFVSFRAAPPS